jgi:hypothetical protein
VEEELESSAEKLSNSLSPEKRHELMKNVKMDGGRDIDPPQD